MSAAAFTEAEITEKWENYKTEFGKNYSDEKEEQMRKKIFTETLLSIEEHNKKFERGEVTFSMGINNFSDQTPEERARSRGFRLPSIEKK
ncbi:crustapain-like [Zophobas morio]|uniref:crustapain-like n=1 Tax=Zophobas morio TaxID=2755281 RepID=UPI00308348C8